MDIKFLVSDKFYTVEAAAKSQDDLNRLIEVSKSERTVVSRIIYGTDRMYQVHAISIKDELQGKQDKCSEETALQILAGISQAVSQADAKGDGGAKSSSLLSSRAESGS